MTSEEGTPWHAIIRRPTPEDHAHWEAVARRARREERREKLLILLVAGPIVLLLNLGWVAAYLVTGRWWLLF